MTSVEQCVEMVRQISALTKDGECSNCGGDEESCTCDADDASFVMENDDAVDSLNSLIEQARGILKDVIIMPFTEVG